MVKSKKITLHAIGNDENFNYYIFDKKQNVMELLSKILWKIFGIDPLSEDSISKKKINIEKFTDIHFSDSSNKGRLDIFYGNKKMFLSLHCSEKLRLKFNEELSKIAIMPKPKKIKSKRK
jgi:hypothetical protein